MGDNGKELPTNQPGEMAVRGPIMKGYYGNPQATAEVMRDGWLYTGDIGRVDEDGYLFFLGRRRKLIIVKGQNIYPGDIETVLRAHPRVAGAVVTGVSDELRGEVVRAVISLKERGAASVGIVTLLKKEGVEDEDLPHIDYIGFRIPPLFVVGYGLDYAERYRHLPYVASLPAADEFDRGEL